MSGASLVPIFATPFAVATVREAAPLNLELVPLLAARAQEAHRDPALPRDALCFRSREDLFEAPDGPLARLRAELLAAACEAIMAANLYAEAEFDRLGLQARARFALVRPDGSIGAATAPMASWCAIYCVAAPPAKPARADSAVLRLYAIRHGTMFMDAANWRLRAPFSSAHHVWRPVAGQIAVFPASILHEVALNRSDTDLILVLIRLRFAHGGQTTMPSW